MANNRPRLNYAARELVCCEYASADGSACPIHVPAKEPELSFPVSDAEWAASFRGETTL